jgi:hypothetical protein
VQGLVDCFGAKPAEQKDGAFMIRYGALNRLSVKIGAGGKSVIVDTESSKDAADDVIIDTNKRFRQYLELVTGFNAKERVKRAKKAIEE